MEDVSQMIKAINYSYRISKVNFIWKRKLEENKKNVSFQLEGVSEAISQMVEEMKQEEKDPFAVQKQENFNLLKLKEIENQNKTKSIRNIFSRSLYFSL